MKVDHIVHYVKNPDAALEVMRAHGVHGQVGGRHVRLGTHNTLCYFGLKYVEFIGFEEVATVSLRKEEIVSFRPLRHVVEEPEREGLVEIAFRVNGLEDLSVRFREAGLKVFGPKPLSRRTPSGEELKWSLLHVERDEELEVPLPFFIDWHMTDEARFSYLERAGYVDERNVDIRYVYYVVRSFERSVELWKKYLGLEEVEYSLPLGNPYKVLFVDGTYFVFELVDSVETIAGMRRVVCVHEELEGEVLVGDAVYSFMKEGS